MKVTIKQALSNTNLSELQLWALIINRKIPAAVSRLGIDVELHDVQEWISANEELYRCLRRQKKGDDRHLANYLGIEISYKKGDMYEHPIEHVRKPNQIKLQ